jgi:ferrochelatase
MSKKAIVLLNMGGPNNLEEVELFLTNMFNDPNIITVKSSLLRKFIATMITFTRTESSQEIYRELGGYSPIVGHTKDVVSALQKRVGEDVVVDFAMRYTPPFATEVVERLKSENIEKIYLIPMYSQYSTTTTKSSIEDFEDALHKSGLNATVYEIKHYFENVKYNEAIIERIKEELVGESSEQYELIFSAHGLPQKIVDSGDVYQSHIIKHVEILKEMLKISGMNFANIELAYQSKVGPMKWLEPALDEVLKTKKNKKVIIYPIAFTIDNSETDYELKIEYEEIAEEVDINSYKVARCVNNHPLFIEALEELYHKMMV